MKILQLTLLVAISLKSFGQFHPDSIKYSLCIYYSCDDTFKKTNEFIIQNRASDTIVEYKPDTMGICYIPKNSNAILYLQASLINNRLVIDYNKESIEDTIVIEPITKAPISSGLYIGPTYYQYYFCGEVCDGVQKSFRKDGKLWQKGHFKHGDAKSLISFYPNGFTEYIIKDRLINGCDKSYDANGKLIFKMSYFIFFTHYKVFIQENGDYYQRLFLKRYK